MMTVAALAADVDADADDVDDVVVVVVAAAASEVADMTRQIKR
jgi:hypothetical protein